jgi:hypothetical protein
MSFCGFAVRPGVGGMRRAKRSKRDAVFVADLPERGRAGENGRRGPPEDGGEYGAFTQSIIQSGNFKAGDALQPTNMATTVRVRDGKTLTTDGPFAETREQLGGYYLVEAKDLDAALEIAVRIPGAKVGSIEVRPIMVYG